MILSGFNSPSDICSYPSSLKISIEEALKKSCNEITEGELSQVTHLKLKNVSGLFEIQPEDFFLLTHVDSLDLSGNKNINEIPEFVYGLKNLRKLNISSTYISDFDSRICQLTQLKVLIGSHNSYRNNEIPFHTFCLSNLMVLDMSNSSIIYMDEYLYYLQNLERLYMADNALFLLPWSFQYLSSLKFVDFTGNIFTNTDLNVVRDCAKEKDLEDTEDCQDDLLDDFDCEWRYRFTRNRGEPLRRYKKMTDAEFIQMEEGGYMLRENLSYTKWLVEQGGFDDFNETSGFDETGNYRGRNSLNAHLLDRTINGKTVREWRLALKLYVGQLTSDDAGYLASFWRGSFENRNQDCVWLRDLDNFWGVEDEYYTADMSEVFPEENKTPKDGYLKRVFDEVISLLGWLFGEEEAPWN